MFSLKSLLLAVLVAAVFVVAFIKYSPFWASVIVMLTVLLLASALISIYLIPNNRPFLVCAVIMGVVYGTVALIRPLGLSNQLITTHLLYDWYFFDKGAEIKMQIRDTLVPNATDESVYWLLAYDLPHVGTHLTAHLIGAFRSLQYIGHCAIALILAVIAGLVGSYVARRRDLKTGLNDVQS
jgi:hypothetical protein